MTNVEKAEELKEKNNFSMRSCWECNPSHEHLKHVGGLFICFACGRWYMNGDYFTSEEHCNAKFEAREGHKALTVSLTPKEG